MKVSVYFAIYSSYGSTNDIVIFMCVYKYIYNRTIGELNKKLTQLYKNYPILLARIMIIRTGPFRLAVASMSSLISALNYLY